MQKFLLCLLKKNEYALPKGTPTQKKLINKITITNIV